MSRTALARTYRPRRFGDVTMQEHVSETLKTAVARGRVAHAYLFSGPRGVGKTTAARVLAMALNCPRRTEEGEPCGECESCERIWSGRTSLDVVEIDAASNRGVDDARDLRERAMYAPTEESRFKVYIIDEAHMLTREAWNALLKILEEPPPRVIFVFATTEPQKIQQAAPPILSRCQRFDFRRISVRGIVDRLADVLAAEGVVADEDALLPLARRAEGGMRDALSLLDQVLSFAGGRVTPADVRRVLGLVDEELYLELFDLLADRRAGDVFPFVRRLLDEGYDLAEFQRGLADALRDLLVVRLEGADALDARGDLREEIRRRAERFGTGDLLRMLSQVTELDVEGRFRKSGNPRLFLEALLLRFAHLDRTVDLEDLIRAAGGEAPAGPPSAGEGTDRVGGSAPRRPSGGTEGAPKAAEPRRRGSDTGTPEDAPPSDARPTRAPGEGPAAGSARGASTTRAVAKPAVAAAERAVRDLAGAAAEGLPPGVQVFLRGASVREVGEGRLSLDVPPGPAVERLGDPLARRAIEAALEERLGRAISLEVRETGVGEGGTARLTPERLRREQLERLTREEPILGQAVREWDLELLE